VRRLTHRPHRPLTALVADSDVVRPTAVDTERLPVAPGPPPLRRRWPRRLGVVALVVVVALGVLVGPSLLHALTRPGSDGVPARLAEWGRDHGLGPMVTWLEARQYDLHQPPVGGVPPGGIPTAPGSEADRPGKRPAPPPLPPPDGLSALPGEGQWQTVVSTPRGAAVRVAAVRPDAQHTSFVTGVMWMDPGEVRAVLHPGTEDPGGRWTTPTSIDTAEQRTVVSAFSAGFRLQGDSHGGWYAEGRAARPLVPGAASLVIHRDGTVDVGAWGTSPTTGEVRMAPDVLSVRQNLVPLVDSGVVNPTCATGGTGEWGSTIGQAAYIHRSAFGVTSDGALVYVGGHAREPAAGRGGGARDGARHQPGLGLGRLFPPDGAPGTRRVPALPRRAGRREALPADLEPGLRLVRPTRGRHRCAAAVRAAEPESDGVMPPAQLVPSRGVGAQPVQRGRLVRTRLGVELGDR